MIKRVGDGSTRHAFELGSREWLALPELGVPAVKAKIDTGARTSALHASSIELCDGPAGPLVRFSIRPVPGREGIEIFCSAPLVDSREVISSNGEREVRYVIETEVSIGGRTWPIQISLTNREQMSYRMLLGRQAIQDDMVVVPNRAFLNPRLGYQLYRDFGAGRIRRRLTIAILMDRASAGTPMLLDLLRQAAAEHGHNVVVVDPAKCLLRLDGETPILLSDGAPVPRPDAVIDVMPEPRANCAGVAILRHLQLQGAFAVNSADALQLAGDEPRTRQLLLHRRLPVAGIDAGWDATAFVVGGRLACAVRAPTDATPASLDLSRADQRHVEAAARAIGLGACAVRLNLGNAAAEAALRILGVCPLSARALLHCGPNAELELNARGLQPLIVSRLISYVEAQTAGRIPKSQTTADAAS